MEYIIGEFGGKGHLCTMEEVSVGEVMEFYGSLGRVIEENRVA